MTEFQFTDQTITVGDAPTDVEVGFQPVPIREDSQTESIPHEGAGSEKSFFRMPSLSMNSTVDGGQEITLDFVERDLKEEEALLALKDDRCDGTTVFERFVPVNDWKSGRWIACGNSLYGLFIRFVLSHHNARIVMLLIPPVFLMGGAQGVILVNLWKSINYVSATPSQFCEPVTNQLFLTSIIAVFLVSLIPALNDVISEFKIVASARLVFQVYSPMAGEGKAAIFRVQRNILNVICCLLVVCYELIIWVAVLLIGIVYILTSQGTGNIVQAAVAISFINEIDNMVMWVGFDTFNLKSVRFRTHPVSDNPGESFFFTIIFVMPVILCVSVGIVYGLHATYC